MSNRSLLRIRVINHFLLSQKYVYQARTFFDHLDWRSVTDAVCPSPLTGWQIPGNENSRWEKVALLDGWKIGVKPSRCTTTTLTLGEVGIGLFWSFILIITWSSTFFHSSISTPAINTSIRTTQISQGYIDIFTEQLIALDKEPCLPYFNTSFNSE